MPSVYSPCPVCDTKRYNQDTLDVTWNSLSIADVLSLSVAEAHNLFANEAPVFRALDALVKVGLGYLRLGQPATELSGGEAQRIKLATELKRADKKTHPLRTRRTYYRASSCGYFVINETLKYIGR